MKKRFYYKDNKGNKYSFKSECKGLIPITEEEFNIKPQINEKQRVRFEIQNQITNLKSQLAQTDYKVLKYIEGKLTLSEFRTISDERQQLRDRINELEKEL